MKKILYQDELLVLLGKIVEYSGNLIGFVQMLGPAKAWWKRK